MLASIYVSWPEEEITLKIMIPLAIVLITIEVIQAFILKAKYFDDPFNYLEFSGNFGVFILGYEYFKPYTWIAISLILYKGL